VRRLRICLMPRDPTPRLRAQSPRFGGLDTPEGYLFELTGGSLCLDLANTLDERLRERPRELLRDYKSACDWGLQAGALSPPEYRALVRRSKALPAEAEKALHRLRKGRETVFETFSAIARGKAVPAAALAALDVLIRAAVSRRGLSGGTGPLAWEWRRSDTPDLDRPLWAAVLSAMDLVTSDTVRRVRQCEGAGCAWLFIDSSKNGSRRWCDMSVCGNRAKARRFRARSGALEALELTGPLQ